MLVLLLSSLLVLSGGSFFKSGNQAYRLLEGQLRLQESAQIALGFIARSLHSAGWMGCPVSPEALSKTLGDDWSKLVEFNILTPFEGVAGQTADWADRARRQLPLSKPRNNRLGYISTRGLKIPSRPSDENRAGWLRNNSDILMVRQMAPWPFVLAERVGSSGNPVVGIEDRNNDGRRNRSDLGNFGFSSNKEPIVLLNDCRKAVLFRVTRIRVSGGKARLYHALGNDRFHNTSSKLTILGQGYEPSSYVGAIQASIFFVAPGTGANNRGQKIFSLWRKQGTGTAQELIPGIERILTSCGVDSDRDGIPNRYLSLEQVTDFNQVVSVRVLLLVNSVDAVYSDSSGDGVLRRVFSRTFRLNNVQT